MKYPVTKSAPVRRDRKRDKTILKPWQLLRCKGVS